MCRSSAFDSTLSHSNDAIYVCKQFRLQHSTTNTVTFAFGMLIVFHTLLVLIVMYHTCHTCQHLKSGKRDIGVWLRLLVIYLLLFLLLFNKIYPLKIQKLGQSREKNPGQLEGMTCSSVVVLSLNKPGSTQSFPRLCAKTVTSISHGDPQGEINGIFFTLKM